MSIARKKLGRNWGNRAWVLQNLNELAAYLARNNTYERTNAIDPRQMGLF
jgi:hypothetical protein